VTRGFPRAAVEDALEARVEAAEPLAGGSISPVLKVRLSDGRLLAMAGQAREYGELDPGMHRRLEWLAGRLERWLVEPDHPAPWSGPQRPLPAALPRVHRGPCP
jgi:hypothetical protein